MMTAVEAFLLGWRACRERGQTAYVQDPRMTPHEVFTEMTQPSKEVAAALIREAYPVTNKPLSEASIG